MPRFIMNYAQSVGRGGLNTTPKKPGGSQEGSNGNKRKAVGVSISITSITTHLDIW